MSAAMKPLPKFARYGLFLAMALAICWLAFSLVMTQRLTKLRAFGKAAAQRQEHLVVRRALLERRAAIAEKDALVRAAARRWTDVIADVHQTSLTSATSSMPPDLSRAAHDKPLPPREASHWAFADLQDVPVPAVNDSRWVRNPIDRFIQARLEESGMGLRPPAAGPSLVRRLWFSILGLAPKPEEITLAIDASPAAIDRLVDDLLARKEAGEHFAQGWLDLARYADSNGYEEDEIRPHAYPYRDFVIWAFNSDLPYDKFVQWQIAGDELHPENPLAVAATGFATAAPYNTFMPQPSERYDELDDIVSTLGTAMLGLTVGCARCHDHPYDNITSEEYYALVSIFKPTRREVRYLLPDGGAAFRALADPVDSRREEVRQLLLKSAKEENIAALDFTEEEKDLLRQPLDPGNAEQVRLLSLCGRCLMVDDTFIDENSQPLPEDQARYRELIGKIEQLAPTLPPRPPRGLTLGGSEVVTTPVLWGGSLHDPGDEVGPRFLSVLTAGEPDWSQDGWQNWATSSSTPRPRTALAKWMTDLDAGGGPVAARVIVNRLWQQHFGTGLVATASNFGVEGLPPSHPKLLEWLAVQLVENNWSLKHIHRLILTSGTYRQTSADCDLESADDSGETRFQGWQPRRLTAEQYRDSLLRLSGRLNPTMFGPPCQPSIPRDAIFNRNGDDPDETWPTDVIERPSVWRRSIYILKRRTNPVPLLQLFDAPDGTASCAKRTTTTVPTQSLALWNSDFVRTQARHIAATVSSDNDNLHAQIDALFQLLLGRQPDAEEKQRSVALLRTASLADLCQVLLMTNEFWYID